jgi:epoxide hydrolase-like predicted phosphatase
MRPKPEMVKFVHDLKARQLQVGLLSNVIPYTMNQIREHCVYDNFDFTILSAEVGYGKPDPEIYQLALDKLPGIRPEEIIFIDDQERFLVPARTLGIHTVAAVDPTQIIAETESLIERLANEA